MLDTLVQTEDADEDNDCGFEDEDYGGGRVMLFTAYHVRATFR
jgi:hypothetical protein